MELTGQFIMMFMNSAEMYASLFGMADDDTSSNKNISIAGQIVGEVPGVGLLIEVEDIRDVSGSEGKQILEATTAERKARLIRWEFISNATLYDVKPNRREVAGFRPRR